MQQHGLGTEILAVSQGIGIVDGDPPFAEIEPRAIALPSVPLPSSSDQLEKASRLNFPNVNREIPI